MPLGFGPWELVIILLIVVVIFGAGRLSEVGGAVGKSIREFRKATTDEAGTDKPAVTTPPPAAPLAGPTVPGPVSATVPSTTSAPVGGVTALAENKCPSCATVNPAEQVFCGQCGTRLTRAA